MTITTFTSLSVVAILVGLGVCEGAVSQEQPSEEEIGTVEVLQSEDAALAEIFPDADSAHAHSVPVDSASREALRSRLGWIVRDTVLDYFDVFESGGIAGTAVVADEQGKYRPITFIAGVDSTFRVVDVRVLVYRESRGGEVRHTRFLKQYRGKSLDNPIRINRDIINIPGATISVNALNAGVRKALAIAELVRTGKVHN
jgi:Na+-translocating ferredoxin:NAD+ oxidoreductase RnfG subunit